MQLARRKLHSPRHQHLWCYFSSFSVSPLSNWLFSLAILIVSFGGTASFTAAILPFLSDQVIGATADELSTLIYWQITLDLDCPLLLAV